MTCWFASSPSSLPSLTVGSKAVWLIALSDAPTACSFSDSSSTQALTLITEIEQAVSYLVCIFLCMHPRMLALVIAIPQSPQLHKISTQMSVCVLLTLLPIKGTQQIITHSQVLRMKGHLLNDGMNDLGLSYTIR